MTPEEMDISEEVKEDLIKRLRRIEGQVRGVQRMIEEERPCSEIVMQLAAVKSAVVQVAMVILSNMMRSCLAQEIRKDGDPNLAMSRFMDVFKKFS